MADGFEASATQVSLQQFCTQNVLSNLACQCTAIRCKTLTTTMYAGNQNNPHFVTYGEWTWKLDAMLFVLLNASVKYTCKCILFVFLSFWMESVLLPEIARKCSFVYVWVYAPSNVACIFTEYMSSACACGGSH